MKRALALLSLFALPVLAAEPNLYGRYEWVSLPELDRTLQAKMDTGAYCSAARNLARICAINDAP